MALSNAEKQEAHRERQRQMASSQAETIASQQQLIRQLQEQIQVLSADNVKLVSANHALEIKLLKAKK
jgi:F0F1-type ATP synthase membrane subunit b/b'